MSEKLTFDKLRITNLRRCLVAFHPLHDWSPPDWACALGGETGEALNKVKKLRRLDGADRKRDTASKRDQLRLEIGKELADVVIYADLLAARLGLDLGDLVRIKFNEVSDRNGCTIKL